MTQLRGELEKLTKEHEQLKSELSKVRSTLRYTRQSCHSAMMCGMCWLENHLYCAVVT